MPTTKQAAAIQAASDLTNLVQTIKGVRDAAQAFLTKYNSESYSATWSAMPTGTQNADGTIGLIDQTAGSGTVSVTAGSAAVTFSASQTALAGTYIVVTGDPTNSYYLVVSGSGTSWVLGSPYGGTTNATASWGKCAPNTANPIIAGGINRPEAKLVSAVVMLQQLGNFFGNAAVATANYNQSIDDLAS
jgi:hypothetical protein